MKTLLLLVIMSLINTNCSIWKDLEPLSRTKEPYNGNQLRIDGYYYRNINDMIYDIYFFYSDGIVLSVSGSEESLEDANNYIFENFINSEDYKDIAYQWGVFNINGNQIVFERWYPSEWPYAAYCREGHISNDTTFIVTESYKLKNGEKTEVDAINEMYHFKQFSPKPDSTNEWIE